MSIRDRITGSKPYLEGLEFTTATATTQLGDVPKQSVGKVLSEMASNGDLSQKIKRRGSVNIAYYKRSGADMRHRPWVTTPSPTEHTPEFC